jgi:hypothetical protein
MIAGIASAIAAAAFGITLAVQAVAFVDRHWDEVFVALILTIIVGGSATFGGMKMSGR